MHTILWGESNVIHSISFFEITNRNQILIKAIKIQAWKGDCKKQTPP